MYWRLRRSEFSALGKAAFRGLVENGPPLGILA